MAVLVFQGVVKIPKMAKAGVTVMARKEIHWMLWMRFPQVIGGSCCKTGSEMLELEEKLIGQDRGRKETNLLLLQSSLDIVVLDVEIGGFGGGLWLSQSGKRELEIYWGFRQCSRSARRHTLYKATREKDAPPTRSAAFDWGESGGDRGGDIDRGRCFISLDTADMFEDKRAGLSEGRRRGREGDW